MKQRILIVATGSLIVLVVLAMTRLERPSAAGAAARLPILAVPQAISKSPGAAPGSPISAALAGSASPLVGDSSLRGEIDLRRAKLDGDRYVIAMDRDLEATLTLEPAIQQAAEGVLERAKAHRGAVVVMSTDGRILALAGRDGAKNAPDLATEVWAPAASVFKIVTAAALIDAGVRPDAPVCYHGGVRSVIASNLSDDPKRDKQCEDLEFAIARSQNAIIAKLAHRHLDPGELRRMARGFGFGALPTFALASQPGRVDIPKDDLAFARVSAGFWRTELSPLGGAMVAGTVASGGQMVTPRIVAEVSDGERRAEVQTVAPKRTLPEHIARDLAHMMVGTTKWGTARKGFHDLEQREFFPGIEVAGKTGTLTRTSPHYMQYSWFVGFAPADNPQVVVSVLIGNPEKWHLKAHTAARIVLQKAL